MSIEIKFPYEGDGFDCLLLPEGSSRPSSYFVKDVALPDSVYSLIEEALDNPIGTDRLSDLLEKRDSAAMKVALIIDDGSRPTPADEILPCILDRLAAAGVRRENITIVIALGTHVEMTGPEIEAKVGSRIYKEYRIENSHFNDESMMSLMGHTASGVPVYIDRTVAEADFRIGVGSIVPHGAVGWSGGGKIIYPGVAGKETVKQFHFMHGLTRRNMKGVEECSVRLEMEKWVEKVGLDFIVNSVLNQDGRVYRIVAGHYVKAQRRGVEYGREIYSFENEEKCDLVIALAYPHDDDFWLAAKGIYAGEQLTKDGGLLILLTPCKRGIGNHNLYIRRCGSSETFDTLNRVLSGELEEPEDVVSLAPASMVHELLKRIDIRLVTPTLDREEVEAGGFSWGNNIQKEVADFLAENPDAKIGIINHSDLTFAK